VNGGQLLPRRVGQPDIDQSLDHDEARIEEDLALARLLDTLNEPQMLILMSYGNFRRALGDTELHDFYQKHPGVLDVDPATLDSGPEEIRREAIHDHYTDELVARGLLQDTEGIAKSGPVRRLRITDLGRLLLQLVGRGGQPNW